MFSRHRLGKDGLRPWCRGCVREYAASNKEHIREYAKEWRDRNRERISEYMAKWRDENRSANRSKNRSAVESWYEKTPGAKKAHREFNAAVKQGLIARPDACSRCGRVGKVHGHHADYSKPMEVEWLCPICHRREHA